jgi:membrane protein
MLRKWLGGLGVGDLFSKVWTGLGEDNVFGAAAELAFYSLLALFPTLIFLTSLVGFLAGVRGYILGGLGKVMPAEAMAIVDRALQDAVQRRSGGLLSLGIIGALWAASNGAHALIDTLNTAYGVRERRPLWKTWLIAAALTIGLSILVAVGSTLIMFGDRLGSWITGFLGLETRMTFVLRLANYPIGLALLLIGLESAYYLGPDTDQKWRWITPGAAFAVVAASVGSVLFSVYLRFAPSYSATYGSLGAVIILMLWLYLVGLAVLVGGEINGLIEDAGARPGSSGRRHRG